MSSSKRKFQNTKKWDGKDDIRTQRLGYQLMELITRTKGSDLERELKIINEATARWGEEKEERKKEREREGCPFLLGSRASLIYVTYEGVASTDMARLDRHGTTLVSVVRRARVSLMGRASACCVTPSWVASTRWTWIERIRYWK
jgi:hypothetical protein